MTLKMNRYTLMFRSLLLASCFFASGPVHACTIFVLTDTNRALFCNNEDCDVPKHRIWFVPAGKKRYGCAYVGGRNQWAQGGLNSKGLAFDWAAGWNEKWTQRNQKKKKTRGNPAQRMLETCSTVDEAVAFFQRYRVPCFSYAKILIADRTGASVIIGAKDNQLQIEKSTQCRRLGGQAPDFSKMTSQEREPVLANAARLLSEVRSEGKYATRYSNVFDLKSGEIFLFRFPDHPDAVKLSLDEELNKGRHYYDMDKIKEQLTQKSKRLNRLKEWENNLRYWLQK